MGKQEHICLYCDKGFTELTNMYRHMKHNCKVRKEQENEKKQIYDELIKLREECKNLSKLRKECSDLRKLVEGERSNKKIIKNSNKIVTNSNNIINSNNPVTINLLAYNKETISKLKLEEIVKSIRGYDTPIHLVEAAHFNPKKPEYHNIYIPNIKEKHVMLYNGDTWDLVDRDDTIEDMYEAGKDLIEENLEDFKNSLSGPKVRALKRWLNTDDDNERINKVKRDIRFLLYNKKNVPICTKKKLEFV